MNPSSLLKMSVYMCIKKDTGTQYSLKVYPLKSIGTVKNPIFYYEKVIPSKSNV